MEIIKEEQGIAVVQIDAHFYVVGIDRQRGQVTSCLSSDSPKEGGSWFGGISTKGVQYVANGRSRSAAMSAFRRTLKAREA